MKSSKSVTSGAERVFVLILDQGEKTFTAITDSAGKEYIDGASVSAIGAFAEPRSAALISRARSTGDCCQRAVRGSQLDGRRGDG